MLWGGDSLPRPKAGTQVEHSDEDSMLEGAANPGADRRANVPRGGWERSIRPACRPHIAIAIAIARP
jgi:hypothetical protein